MTLTVCFHGAESTGKSVLAHKLAQARGWPVVAEYGRTWAETHGTDFTMADLLAIADGHAAATQEALAAAPEVLILDTDPLLTAAWAAMLFGEVPPALLGHPKADHYLLFDADVPWVDDGTRFFGTADERAQFAALAEEMLVRTGVPFTRVGGDWAQRETQVVAVLESLLEPPVPSSSRT